MKDSVVLIQTGAANPSSGRGLPQRPADINRLELELLKRINIERDPARNERLRNELEAFRVANGLRTPGPGRNLTITAPPGTAAEARQRELDRATDRAIEQTRELFPLPRYDGQKPRYVENPAHRPGPTLRPGKTPLPPDAAEIYRNAVPNNPTNPTAWFGRNAKGEIYRFSVDNNGTAHFSGIDGVGSGTRNLTEYARRRLEGK